MSWKLTHPSNPPFGSPERSASPIPSIGCDLCGSRELKRQTRGRAYCLLCHERRGRWPFTLAAAAVNLAVRQGVLVRPSICSDCQRPPTDSHPIHGHHESYALSRWLDVIWLCRLCHKKRHREIGPARNFNKESV